MKKMTALILVLALAALTVCSALADSRIAPPAFADLEQDPYAVEKTRVEEPNAAKENSGTVTISMTDTMKLDHENELIEMMYEHAFDSTHAAVCQIIINVNGEEILLAQSGVIPAGYGLYRMDALPDTHRLQEGYHSVTLRLLFYDPATGVRADFNTDIPAYLLA